MLTERYQQRFLLDFSNPATEAKFLSHRCSLLPDSPLSLLSTALAVAIAVHFLQLCTFPANLFYLFPLIRRQSRLKTRCLRAISLGIAWAHSAGYEFLPILFYMIVEQPVAAQWLIDLLLYVVLGWSLHRLQHLPGEVLIAAGTVFLWERNRRRMWEDLDRSQRRERQLTAVISHLPVGVAVIDQNYAVRLCNRKASSCGLDWDCITAQSAIKRTLDFAWKCEIHSELIDFPSLFAVVRSATLSWNAVNCCLLCIEDVSDHRSSLRSSHAQFQLVLEAVSRTAEDTVRVYREAEESRNFLSLCRLSIIRRHLLMEKSLIAPMLGSPPLSLSTFNLRSELTSHVELNSSGASAKGLFVSLIFDQGLPRTVEGHKDSTEELFTTLWKTAVDLSQKGTSLAIALLITGAQEDNITVTVKVELVGLTTDASEAVAVFTQGKLTESRPWSIEKSALEAFFLCLQSEKGASDGRMRACPVPNCSTVSLAYCYSLRTKQRETPISALLPSSVRRSVSCDKFAWDFRPSAQSTGGGSRRFEKQYSLRAMGKPQKYRHSACESELLSVIADSEQLKIAAEDIADASPPREELDSKCVEMVSRGVIRHPCNISSKSCSTNTSPVQKSRVTS